MIEKPFGWFRKEEGFALQNLIKALTNTAVIVELGTWCGLSTSYIADVLMASQVLFTIDSYENSKPVRHSGITHADARNKFLSLFFGESLYRKHIFQIIGESKKIAQFFKLKGCMVDLLFIDADHEYESVKDDYLSWGASRIKCVVFHDYQMCQGVTKFVDEIKCNHTKFTTIKSLAILEEPKL